MNSGEYKESEKRVDAEMEMALLRRENQQLKKQITTLQENQEKLASAVDGFVKKAGKVSLNAKLSMNKSLTRMKVYELKLISYYDKLIKKYPIDADLTNVSEFVQELKSVMREDFFSKDHLEVYSASKELKRMGIGAVAPEMIAPSESGFDFFEAMNPEKDLEELCRELGLMAIDQD